MIDKRVEAAAKVICLELNGTIFRDADNNEQEEAIFLATSALAASDAAAWQPIETAPRDGTEIIGYDGSIVLVSWLNNSWWSDVGATFYPTHWQPLPAPPSDATEGEK